MPVMVMGVENVVGAHAAHLLASRGGEVRVFVRAPALDGEPRSGQVNPQTYRDLGCKVAHGHLDDEAHVETALEQVHTLLLLLGRPTDDPDTYLEHAATAVSAAIGAGTRRLVMLSDLAVSDPRGNAWLQALDEAEQLVEDAPLESLVLRCAAIYDAADPLTVAIAAGALGDGPEGAHWPIAAADVAVTAVTADADRDLDTSLHVQVPLAGPSRVTTASFAARLAQVLPAGEGEALPPAALDLLSRTIERPTDALGQSGLSLDALSS